MVKADHPAVKFGAWLKEKRREKRIVARVFAGSIGLSPAQYAEVEAGIVHWIKGLTQLRIETILDLTPDDLAAFNHMLYLAREAGEVQFDDVFSRDQLAPVRLCHTN